MEKSGPLDKIRTLQSDKGEFIFDGSIFRLPKKYGKRVKVWGSDFFNQAAFVDPTIDVRNRAGEIILAPSIKVVINGKVRGEWKSAGRIKLTLSDLEFYVRLLKLYQKKLRTGKIVIPEGTKNEKRKRKGKR